MRGYFVKKGGKVTLFQVVVGLITVLSNIGLNFLGGCNSSIFHNEMPVVFKKNNSMQKCMSTKAITMCRTSFINLLDYSE